MQDLCNTFCPLRTHTTTNGRIDKFGQNDIGEMLILLGESRPDMFLDDEL